MHLEEILHQLEEAVESEDWELVQKSIDSFISNCFDDQGNKNADSKYLAIAGKGSKHCKWCPFKTDDVNCPKKERIRE